MVGRSIWRKGVNKGGGGSRGRRWGKAGRGSRGRGRDK